MWSVKRTTIRDGLSETLAPLRNGAAASFAEVIAAWRREKEFRDFFIRELAAVPFPAFFWEMPPIRRETVGRDYECVTIRSDALARMPSDPDAFAEKFRDATDSVVAFRNLGGDALLVAPCPLNPTTSYAHLAAFLRTAPETESHELFASLAAAIEGELRRAPARIWISTSGLGIGWLHIRLDSFPKYYQHSAYANSN